MSDPATIVVFPGDGIGPEVTRDAVGVLEVVAARHGFGPSARRVVAGWTNTRTTRPSVASSRSAGFKA